MPVVYFKNSKRHIVTIDADQSGLSGGVLPLTKEFAPASGFTLDTINDRIVFGFDGVIDIWAAGCFLEGPGGSADTQYSIVLRLNGVQIADSLEGRLVFTSPDEGHGVTLSAEEITVANTDYIDVFITNIIGTREYSVDADNFKIITKRIV
jgi:hypothetical protein